MNRILDQLASLRERFNRWLRSAALLFLPITLVTLAFGPGKFSLDAGVAR